ncbi:MAG: RHS repeat-associated core domain-containing protein [Rhodanobacter sp.]
MLSEYTDGWIDYVWLNGRLVGRVAGGQLYAIHNDQVGRPEAVTNASKAIVWRAQNFAFNQKVVTSGITFNLGFPGQYYDAETAAWNNGFRDYKSELGRYLESDPIGLDGGINTYVYVNGNPIDSQDALGLCDCDKSKVPQAPPGVDLSKNVGLAENLGVLADAAGPAGESLRYSTFYKLVKNKGPWDYKQQGSQYQDFENFNYGATGAAAGIPGVTLLRAAGAAQVRAGTSTPSWGSPFGGPPYGDDPNDQAKILAGIKYYLECLK